MDGVTKLQDLLIGMSDGTWEHGPAIQIHSLDNPGWKIEVSLNETRFADSLEVDFVENQDPLRWLHVRTVRKGWERYLVASCAADRLGEAIDLVNEILLSKPDGM